MALVSLQHMMFKAIPERKVEAADSFILLKLQHAVEVIISLQLEPVELNEAYGFFFFFFSSIPLFGFGTLLFLFLLLSSF